MAGLSFGAMIANIATSTTPKSCLGIVAPANQRVKIFGVYASIDGADATKRPALIEICTCTFATNLPGTNSTVLTPKPRGTDYAETIQTTAGYGWSAEPTVVTMIENILVPSCMGTLAAYYPFEQPIIIKGGVGAVIRVTQLDAITPNFTGGFVCEE